jgi:type III pantothenate kinase
LALGGEARYKELVGATQIYPMLLIDAGNSAVKFAVVSRAGATPRLLRSVPTAKLSVAIAKKKGAKTNSVFVASVVPSASRILKKAFPSAHFIGPRTALPFMTWSERKTIGSDRLANVGAAHARYERNVLVASFGTAATFDIIDAKGIHRGGAIAPGWGAFSRILAARTALLPRIEAKPPVRFAGRNTREAMDAGLSGGYAALVSHLIEQMKKEAGVKTLRVVFTGGDASAVARIIRLKAVSDPLLTLRGIAILAQGVAREASK